MLLFISMKSRECVAFMSMKSRECVAIISMKSRDRVAFMSMKSRDRVDKARYDVAGNVKALRTHLVLLFIFACQTRDVLSCLVIVRQGALRHLFYVVSVHATSRSILNKTA